MSKKYHLNQRLIVCDIVEEIDEFGNKKEVRLNQYNIWAEIKPILDNKIIFSDGLNGVVNFSNPAYKVFTSIKNEIFTHQYLISKTGRFLVIKTIDLFDEYQMLVVTKV